MCRAEDRSSIDPERDDRENAGDSRRVAREGTEADETDSSVQEAEEEEEQVRAGYGVVRPSEAAQRGASRTRTTTRLVERRDRHTPLVLASRTPSASEEVP